MSDTAFVQASLAGQTAGELITAYQPRTGVSFSGYIAGTTLTVTSGTPPVVGETVLGAAAGTTVEAISGSTATVNVSQTLGSSASPVALSTASDIAASFAYVSDAARHSPNGSIQASSNGRFKAVSTSGTADEWVTAGTKANTSNIDLSIDVHFGAAGESGGTIVRLFACDDGTGSNYYDIYLINRTSGNTIEFESMVAGTKTSAVASSSPAASANTTYTLMMSLRGSPGSQTVAIFWGQKGTTLTQIGSTSTISSSLVVSGNGVGWGTTQLSTTNDDTNGLYVSNFVAANYSTSIALAAGAVTPVAGSAQGAVNVQQAGATGGTAPYSYQIQRAPDASGSPGAWANDGAASSTPATVADTGLTVGSTYWYRQVVTDSAGTPATAYSTAVSYTVPAPAFGISAAPGSLVLAQGQSLTLAVQAQFLNGYAGSPALSVSGLPTGVTASFSPSQLSSTALTSTLTLTAAGNATTGAGNIQVQASDGTITQTTPVLLQVNPPSGVVYPTTSTVQDSDLVTITRNGSTEQVAASVLKQYLGLGGT